MLRFLRKKKAQSTAEYAIIIGLVIAAAMAMQIYIGRSMKGSIKFALDKAVVAGGGEISGNTTQYEPYYLESEYTTTVQGHQEYQETGEGGEYQRYQSIPRRVGRKGEQIIKAVPEEGQQGQNE
ncbi:hypothetical protein ACFL1K_04280 [Candidatus Omnitrophota bacterium]